MAASQAIYSGSFADPVMDAQSVFVAVMNALARPGTVQPVRAGVRPPAPLNRTSGALALALFDADTPVHLDPALRNEETVGWIAYQTGAPVAASKAEASFAIVAGIDAMLGLECFSLGTQEYPDRSTTLIIQVPSLEGGEDWVMRGPGMETEHRLSVAGVSAIVADIWARNNALFPRGVDVILAAPDAMIGLPRTTRLSPRAEV